MKAEVDAFTAEINKRRATTEEAMKAECKNYANKIYALDICQVCVIMTIQN